MIKELGELNEKFYELYGRLHKNKSLLAIKPEQIQYMATALFNQYKAEYKLLAMRAEIREQRELYDAELRHNVLVPRKRFFLFRNRAMKQLDAEILDELEAWFAQREQSEASRSAREELPLGWEEQKKEPETAGRTAAGGEGNQAAEQAQSDMQQQPVEQAQPDTQQQSAQPENNVADNAAQPAEQAQPDIQQPEQSAQAATSEQPAALPEQTRSKKRNAAVQVPGQLSLLNV